MEEKQLQADTIPQESQQTATESGTASAPMEEEQTGFVASEEQPEESLAVSDEADKASDGLTVRFNHEDVTLKEDEARTYAQKGMYYEKLGLDELYSRLSEYAESNGLSVEEIISGFKGEDSKESLQEQKPTLEEKIADDFAELQKEFSDIKTYADLPYTVKKAALEGENLMTAYLYHLHTENKAIAEAEKSAERAKNSSTGSVNSTQIEETVDNAFMAGLWGR